MVKAIFANLGTHHSTPWRIPTLTAPAEGKEQHPVTPATPTTTPCPSL